MLDNKNTTLLCSLSNSKTEDTDQVLKKAELEYQLSNDLNEFDKPFVLASDGTTIFGIMPAESGLNALPIKLSFGENNNYDNRNHGYGILHIEAGHGNQIRANGFSSIEEFAETVARFFDTVRLGHVICGNQTFLLEVSGKLNLTLFIQISRDGTYWNINSAGIFKKKYSRRKPKVFTRPAFEPGTNTDSSGVNRDHTEGVTATSRNSPQTSAGKDKAENPDKQENEKDNSFL